MDMSELMSAIGRLRLGVPLWAVAACGILAGAFVAQETRPSHAAEPAPVIAPVGGTAATPATPAPRGITFLDSPRDGSQPAAATAAAPAPHASSSGGFERIGLMLLALIAGVIGLAVWKRKKERPGKVASQLAVLGQVRVAGRWSVALVKVPGKTLVLGATEKGLSLLSTIDETDPDLDEADAVDPLAKLIAEQDDQPTAPAAAMRASAPPRPPMPSSATEPFSRLLDQLVGAKPANGPATTPPPTSSASHDARDPRIVRPTSYGSGARAPAPAATQASEPRADRLLTPQADALRARLERFQTPTA